MNTEQLISAYIKLRDAKQELTAKHREELAPYNERLGKIEGIIQLKLQEDGLSSFKTKSGTAFTSTKTSYKIDSLEEVWEYAKENNLPELFERKLNNSVASEIGEVPGAVRETFLKIMVRRS